MGLASGLKRYQSPVAAFSSADMVETSLQNSSCAAWLPSFTSSVPARVHYYII